jgi:hypothetical protein
VRLFGKRQRVHHGAFFMLVAALAAWHDRADRHEWFQLGA